MDQYFQDKPHVVIIGTGFGGLETTNYLADKDVRVSVVDKHNHHLFQPLLYQVATAALTAAEIADFRGFKLSGFPGWILWCVAHVYFLVGFRNHLMVCLQWFFSYMTYHRGVRLIIGESGIPEEDRDEPKK